MNMEDFIYRLALGLPGLLMAVVGHEFAHAFVAFKLGDPTPRDAGRITFNPLPHMDMLGSVIIPLVGALLGGVMFGWARPVPINTRHFKNIRRDLFWVSFAGPLANFFLLVISSFLCALIYTKASSDFYLYGPLISIFQQSIYINAIIGVFNLIPFPPLDGSKMLMSFLNYEAQRKFMELSRYSLIFLIVIMVTGVTRYLFHPALKAAEVILGLFIALLR